MTIRLRLTLLFTVLVSVLLIGFAAAVYILLSVERAKDFDTLMASRGLLAGIVVLEKNEVDSALHTATVLRFERSALPEEHITVYDSDNKIVFDSDSLLQHPHRILLTDNLAALKTARMGTSVYISNPVTLNLHPSTEGDMVRLPGISPFEVRFRSLYLPYDDENKRYVVVIRAFDRDGAQTEADTSWILMISVLSSMVLVFGIGWVFAGRMLRPVEGMTRLAEEISAKDLATRLPEGNGRDELAHLARAFNAMFVRLEQAFVAKKQFVAHASHEIRTPLTSMIGEIGVALSQQRSEAEYRETLDSVLSVALQMRQMASDLLHLARVESGTSAQEFSPCELDEIVLAAVETIQETYPESRLQTTIDLEDNDESYTMRGNPEILRLVVVNVLDNAVKYSPPTSLVIIHLHRAGRYFSLEISDSGCGIPPEEQSKVFDPFYRSDRTRNIAGTGVGLAFVARAVQLHGGEVRLASVEGRGTTITVSVPAAV
jgi:heavy metal sensor kinase